MSVKERWIKTMPLKYSTDEAAALMLATLKEDPRILIVYLFGSRLNDT